MTHIANWKDPPFLMGKSTISGDFSVRYGKLPEGIFKEIHVLIEKNRFVSARFWWGWISNFGDADLFDEMPTVHRSC